MKQNIDIDQTANFPSQPNVDFIIEQKIGNGSDLILYALIDFAEEDTAWINAFPEYRGEFIIPDDIAQRTNLSLGSTIKNPSDISTILNAPWSVGFMTKISDQKWLLFAQTM